MTNPLAPPTPEATAHRWGLGDALGGYLTAIVASNVASVVLVLIDPNALTTVTGLVVSSMGLWVGFLGAPVHASRTKGSGRLRLDFGLWQRWFDPLVGLPLGVLAQVVVVPLVYVPIFWIIGERDVSDEARELLGRGNGLSMVALVLVVGIGAPIVEEVFFRGLFQRSAVNRLGRVGGVILVAVAFAATHLQPLQFPGLLVAGLLFGILADRFGRLGPPIWAHIGFNLTTVVVLTMV